MEILSLGEKIKRKRKEKNMTLKDLAGDRITPGQISLVESGKSNPSMDLLEYIADKLEITVEYLIETEETQAEKICVYYENVAEAYIMNENLYSGAENISKALYYAEKYKLEYRKAKILYLKGYIHMLKGEDGLAQQYFLSSNVLFIKNNCYEEVIKTFLNLGKISINLKAYHSGVSYFQQAERVFLDNKIGNDFLIGEIYYYIAFAYFKLENNDKSMNYTYLAKEKFAQINDTGKYAKTLLLLCEEYNSKGDIEHAIKYSEKALKLFKEINNMEYVGDIENNIGRLFAEFENSEEAFEHFKSAKQIRKKINDVKLLETLIDICENYIKIKDMDNAKESLKEIYENTEKGTDEDLIKYYVLKYKINMIENDIKEAENTLVVALNFANNMQLQNQSAELSIMLGKFYLDLNKKDEASIYLDKGVEMFKELGIIKDF